MSEDQEELLPVALPDHVSIKEAVALTNLHADTVRSYVDSGILKGFRLPRGHRRVLRKSIEELINARTDASSVFDDRKPGMRF